MSDHTREPSKPQNSSRAAPADRFQAIADQTFDIIAILDESNRFRYLNRQGRRILGYESASLPIEGRGLIHRADIGAVRSVITELRDEPGGRRSFRCRVAHSDGRWRHLEAIATNMADGPAVQGLVIICRDVTERDEGVDELAKLRGSDAVTGLPLRQTFVDDVKNAAARQERNGDRYALLAVDIDAFHAVNVAFGHAVGDAVLAELGERLASNFRSYDTVSRIDAPNVVSRLGGDEFLVLCHDIGDPGTGATIAERIVETVARRAFREAAENVALTVSVGVVVPSPGADVDDLVVAAESAMRQAKRDGGNRFAVPGAFGGDAERTRELQQAIEAGQLVLHYQPKIELASGRLLGAEALVRWEHPTRGLVPPGEFISLAESSGLIGDLGTWALRAACRQAVAWNTAARSDSGLMVCVNVSAKQFDAEFPDLVAEVLRSEGLSGEQLCLELTESVLMTNVEAAIETMRAIKQLGVEISIDDFGTGYSSLAYLKRFPLDELKIDRSFISGLGTDPDDTAIVGAITAMAHALGLEVIAEGVETEEQLARLRVLGCGVAQGFLFSRPGSCERARQLRPRPTLLARDATPSTAPR